MWELDHKEGWALKNWCFWTVVLEKTLESLRQQGDPTSQFKGNQSWIFIGRIDAELEASILWPADAKSWLTGKDLYAGKDWRQEKGTPEDEMVGCHYWLNGHEFEQALEDGERQGILVGGSPWGRKEVDMTEQLKNNNIMIITLKWSEIFIINFCFFSGVEIIGVCSNLCLYVHWKYFLF